MKKYLTLFRINWQNSLQYRASTVIYIVGYTLYISVVLYLWMSVYHDGNKLGEYSLTDLLTYYLLQLVVNILILSYISWELIDQIREGFFSNFLIKPLNLLFYWFTVNLSGKILEAIYLGIIGCLLYFFTKEFFGFPHHLMTYVFFVFSLILGLTLAFLMDFCIALIAFWLIQVRVFKFMLLYLIFFFSGAILPLDLFPLWLQKWVNLLPFQYLAFVPIKIFLEKEKNFATLFSIEFFWLFFFFVLANWMLVRGVKKYEAVGG
ncbi:MAG: ABC transporter permease [Nitrospiria bacterium]